VDDDFCGRLDKIDPSAKISSLFVREHGVHAGPKDYFVVVVVVVICG
jgi:hypothetical protein